MNILKKNFGKSQKASDTSLTDQLLVKINAAKLITDYEKQNNTSIQNEINEPEESYRKKYFDFLEASPNFEATHKDFTKILLDFLPACSKNVYRSIEYIIPDNTGCGGMLGR